MKKKSTSKKILYDILIVIALFVFLFSGYKLFHIYYLNYQEGQETKSIQKIAKVKKDPEKEAFTIDWKALQKKNPNIIGWILIPDTDISYPIVQGQDNDYYLTHTFENKENYAGAIFLDAYAQRDFKDKNTIIYGHNVKYGTMFADLEKFKDAAFYNKHPYVYLFTPKQTYRAEVFSFYTTEADSASYRLQYVDDEDYLNYLDMVYQLSDTKRKTKFQPKEHIVTLSTCSYERNGQPSNLRYLLHAKLVKWNGSYKK